MRPLLLLLSMLVALMTAACGAEFQDGSFAPEFDPPEVDPPDTPVGTLADSVFVLDGDTFDIELDGQNTEVRLMGINTPERDECFGSEARSFARSLTDGAAVSVVGSEFDQFGRLLGYVYADDTLVNAELVASGHALALSLDHPRRDEFKSLERQAAGAATGLWGEAACPPAYSDELEVTELVFDAPGPDDENPNGEFIEVTNRGTGPAELAGWIIRDESSRHRYRFGDLTLAPGESVTVFSGCGDDSEDRLYWCASDPVWSNGGDTAYLLDPSGNYRALRGYSG